MKDLRLALRQVWYINKAFIRNPATLFFTLIFPLMFLVIFTVIFGNGHVGIVVRWFMRYRARSMARWPITY